MSAMVAQRTRFALAWFAAILTLSCSSLAIGQTQDSAGAPTANAATANEFLQTLTAEERAWLRQHPVIRVAQDPSSIAAAERTTIYRRWLPIQHDQGFNYTRLWPIAAVFALLLIGLGAWNARLTREIGQRKRAEASTAQMLRRLTEAQRIGKIGDWDFDLATGSITWSPQTFEILGRDPSLGPPQSYEENAAIYEPAGAALMAEAVAAAIASGKAQEYAIVAIRPDGLRVPVQAMAVPRKDGTGKVVSLYGTVQDVSADKRAVRLLRESEERLNFAMDAAAIGGWDLDLRTNVVNRSLRHGECFGYAEMLPEWGYDTFLAHIEPADRDRVDASFRKAMAGQDAYEEEFRARWPDGSVHWLWTKGRFYFDEAGQPYRVAGIVVDVSERKEAAADRSRILHVLEATLNEIYMFDAQTLRFQYANDCARRNLGYSMEAMRAMTPVDFKPEFSEATFNEMIGALRRHEKEKLIFQTVHRRADGSLYPVEVHLQLVERDGDDVFLAVINDITERRRAEDALRTSEREFRTLADAVPQIVWITRADGWNIYFNQQWVDYTGLTLEESSGTGWLKPFHPEDQPRAWAAWQNATQNIGDYTVEGRLRRADGSYRWWLIRGTPLRDASGKILKWFGTCTDIEDIKLTEQSVREQLDELLRWQTVTLGREGRVRELKAEVNALLAAQGQPARYERPTAS